MITKYIDASMVGFDCYVNGVKVSKLHQPMGLKKYCSDAFPIMGQATFILEDGTRVHASKIEGGEQNANGDFNLTLKD